MSRESEYYSEPPAVDELRLRYQTVDEAIPRLIDFLYDRYAAGFRSVKIIHGKGTGTLRLTVRRELGRQRIVRRFRTGESHEGGEGVTIVEFTEK